MRDSFWIALIMILGIICIVFINFFQIYTNTDEQNYMLLKETTEAAMYDAVDMNAYNNYKQIRINREMFVESFIRRFSESVSLSNTYVIEIYDVNETPPKVSLKVSSKLGTKAINNEVLEFDIVNRIDAILEATN